MSSSFSSPVIVLVPRPYFWFSAKPAISLVLLSKFFFSAPQIGHVQSCGSCFRRRWHKCQYRLNRITPFSTRKKNERRKNRSRFGVITNLPRMWLQMQLGILGPPSCYHTCIRNHYTQLSLGLSPWSVLRLAACQLQTTPVRLQNHKAEGNKNPASQLKENVTHTWEQKQNQSCWSLHQDIPLAPRQYHCCRFLLLSLLSTTFWFSAWKWGELLCLDWAEQAKLSKPEGRKNRRVRMGAKQRK